MPPKNKTVSARRRIVIRTLVPCYLLILLGVPLALAGAGVFLATTPTAKAVALAAPPIIVVLSFPLLAGSLSRLTLRSIVQGKFPRDLGHELYGPRRLYALCWTSLYYCGPICHAVLAIPALRAVTLRLFGYRVSLDFQT